MSRDDWGTGRHNYELAYQFDAITIIDQHIGGLNVPVDPALLVYVGDALAICPLHFNFRSSEMGTIAFTLLLTIL